MSQSELSTSLNRFIQAWVRIVGMAFLQAVDPRGGVELDHVKPVEVPAGQPVKAGQSLLRIEKMEGSGGFLLASADSGFASSQSIVGVGQQAASVFPLFLEEVLRTARERLPDFPNSRQVPAQEMELIPWAESGSGYLISLTATTVDKANHFLSFLLLPSLCSFLDTEAREKQKADESEAEPDQGLEEPNSELTRPGKRGNIDMIMDIELSVTVSFGQTRMLLKDVMMLGTGSIVELDRLADDQVDLWVNNKRIARGEGVIVGGNYGVRICEVEALVHRINLLGG